MHKFTYVVAGYNSGQPYSREVDSYLQAIDTLKTINSNEPLIINVKEKKEDE